MSWELLKFKSARIVSHRCTPLGSESPDTSFRQCIVRLESEQQLSVRSISPASAAQRRTRALAWMPKSAQAKQNAVSAKSSAGDKQTVRDTVVEYVVMQTRVIRGKPEEWKLWGFTKATTPEVLQEDEDYWMKTIEAQSASART
jgi:protein MBA1